MLAAARNNAHWCDLVCRSHGVPTRFDDDRWVSLRRSPPWYPDAVTLRPGAAAGEVLEGVDLSPGCSVKDSFADLDLEPAGFRVLFEAQWIHRPSGPAPGGDAEPWREVTTGREMRQWLAAHGGGGNIRTSVLENPLVTVFASFVGDTLISGALCNRSGEVVGVSNVFAVGRDAAEVWPGAISAIVARYPDAPLVGYEEAASLTAAREAGFAATGPLRVWVND